MLELFTEDTLLNRLYPEDVFNGDGTTAIFDLVNLGDNVVRVFVDEILVPPENYTIADNSGWEINFGTNIPAFGTNNIILQSDTCMLYPPSGSLNGYRGESVDINYFINNSDALKGYESVVIEPIDQIGGTQMDWIKLATTQGGLDSAVAGANLEIGDITDNGVAHGFWVRVIVPSGYLNLNDPAETKYDIALKISGLEYDL